MIRNVLKPDGTAHIEQQVGNMRYDLTTGQVDTVVPGAGATNLVFGADGRPHVELTTGTLRRLPCTRRATGPSTRARLTLRCS